MNSAKVFRRLFVGTSKFPRRCIRNQSTAVKPSLGAQRGPKVRWTSLRVFSVAATTALAAYAYGARQLHSASRSVEIRGRDIKYGSKRDMTKA